MKKITYLFAAMVAALGFSSCDETWDDNPTLITHEGDPVEKFLNTPVESKTAILITDENKNGTLLLTGSQPTQYGYAASVIYNLEMSLNQDFTTPAVEGDEIPALINLGKYADLSKINPSLRSVAEGICKMLNIQDEALIPTDYMPVYMRLRANVVNESGSVVPNTAFTSNTICYEKISVGYLDMSQFVVEPGLSRKPAIYIRGALNEWLDPQFKQGTNKEVLPKYEFLSTTEPNTFELEFIKIPANSEFKIADETWGNPNLSLGGAVTAFDTWLPCIFNTMDNTKFSSEFTGSITVKGSGEKWEVMFTPIEAVEPDKPSGIFLVGLNEKWTFDDPTLEFLTTESPNVWRTKVVTIPAGVFKVADPTWSITDLGTNGTNIVPGTRYECIAGATNIPIAEPFTGTVTLRKKGLKWYITLDLPN